MCGRYYLETHLPPEEEKPELIAALNRDVPGFDRPAQDIRPGDEAPVVTQKDGQLSARTMRWGFAGQGGIVINARVESIHEKPMFRGLVDRQRCALPAAGYYEWRDADGQKYRIGFAGGEWFCLAGLYRYGMKGPEFVVLTRPPAPQIAPIHDRMPLMLDIDDGLDRWLGGAQPPYDFDYKLDVNAVGPEQLQMTF